MLRENGGHHPGVESPGSLTGSLIFHRRVSSSDFSSANRGSAVAREGKRKEVILARQISWYHSNQINIRQLVS